MKRKLSDLEKQRDLISFEIKKEKAQNELSFNKTDIKNILSLGQDSYNKSVDEK